jgi:3-hydroxyacyl-CoA dehydrogenase/enoyl-CoA hydratase/3-hydroxybutyryl-CoA epimerase
VIASAADGDLGAVLGLGFPPCRGGPFHFVDGDGAALVVAELERLAAAHGPRFAPAPLLIDLAASGGRFYPGRG